MSNCIIPTKIEGKLLKIKYSIGRKNESWLLKNILQK